MRNGGRDRSRPGEAHRARPGALILPPAAAAPSDGPVPDIWDVEPSQLNTTGGQTVTVTAFNLVAPLTVTFGGAPATHVTITAPDQDTDDDGIPDVPGTLTCTAPAHAASPTDNASYDVVVTTANGASTDGTGYVQFIDPALVARVDSVTPSSLNQGSPNTITITGANLLNMSGHTFVLFSAGPGNGHAGTVNDEQWVLTTATDTELVMEYPFQPVNADWGPGTLVWDSYPVTTDVRVAGRWGTYSAVNPDATVGVDQVEIDSITPLTGDTAGGDTVTITGVGLSLTFKILFRYADDSHVDATDLTVTDTEVTFTTPGWSFGKETNPSIEMWGHELPSATIGTFTYV